jgi:hypothetical protein
VAESLRRTAGAVRAPFTLPRPSAALRSLASARLAPISIFAVALSVGALVRVAAVGAGDGFPLNDGGMFLVMVEDIRANSFGLPERTSYNGGDIAFAYPPLPFYLAAFLGDAFGWTTLDLLIYLPLLFSVLTIPAFWLLARSVLGKPMLASLATLLFVSVPRSYNWEVVGGGLTRSPGLFFATLALWQVFELFRSGRRVHLAPAVVLSALTVLCHMEMGWFVAFSSLFFAAWHRRDRRVYANAAMLAGGVALLTAPWYLSILLRSGLDALLSALQAGDHSPLRLLTPLLLRFTDDTLFPVALALALLGLLVTLRDRRYLLPVWLLLIFVLDPRKAATVGTLPLAMLASIGLMQAVWPLMRDEATGRAPRWAFAAAGFLLVVFAPSAALLSANGNDSPVHALSSLQREAMEWAGANTPESARFAVIPSANRWANDAPSEWFPALAGRVSLNTVQGAEWLGKATYAERQASFDALAGCAGGDASCIDTWASQSGGNLTHVFVPKGESAAGRTWFSRQQLDCCRPLIDSLRTSGNYRLVFENEGAAIFERTVPLLVARDGALVVDRQLVGVVGAGVHAREVEGRKLLPGGEEELADRRPRRAGLGVGAVRRVFDAGRPAVRQVALIPGDEVIDGRCFRYPVDDRQHPAFSAVEDRGEAFVFIGDLLAADELCFSRRRQQVEDRFVVGLVGGRAVVQGVEDHKGGDARRYRDQEDRDDRFHQYLL